MFNKKRLFALAAVMLASFLGVSAANAQGPGCPLTVASLQGTYSVIGNYGSNLAISLGSRYYDGNGNLTVTFLVNEPTVGSTTGARTIVTGTQKGTYTVNCNGTGTFTRILSTSNGITATAVDDFIITGAVRSLGGTGNIMIATTIIDAQETPSAIVPGGVFLTRVHTRLPDFSSNY